jgi:hypothetical protein
LRPVPVSRSRESAGSAFSDEAVVFSDVGDWDDFAALAMGVLAWGRDLTVKIRS